MDDIRVRRHVCANKGTLLALFDSLRPLLQKQTTVMRMAISAEERVAVALFHYGNGGTFRQTATQFGIGESTAPEIFWEFVDAMLQDHSDEMCFPDKRF